MVYYDTPHDSDPVDGSNPKTENFFAGRPGPRRVDGLPARAVRRPERRQDDQPAPVRLVRRHAPRPGRQRALPARAAELHPERVPAGGGVRRPRAAAPIRAALRHDAPPLGLAPAVEERVRSVAPEDRRTLVHAGRRRDVRAALGEALETDLFAGAARHRARSSRPRRSSTARRKTRPPTPAPTRSPTTASRCSPSRCAPWSIRPARRRSVSSTATGAPAVARNDGTTKQQVTPIYLLIDALKGMDQAFADYAAANQGSTDRHDRWRAARSQLTDTFLTITGSGATSDFANQAVPKILPTLIDAIRDQVTVQCPDARINGSCPWARGALTTNLSTTVDGPLFAAGIDLLDSVRSNDAARTRARALAPVSARQRPGGRGAVDGDRGARHPPGTGGRHQPDAARPEPRRSDRTDARGRRAGTSCGARLADALVEVLRRVLARAYDAQGTEICADEIDPNRTFAAVLANLVVTPMATTTCPRRSKCSSTPSRT